MPETKLWVPLCCLFVTAFLPSFPLAPWHRILGTSSGVLTPELGNSGKTDQVLPSRVERQQQQQMIAVGPVGWFQGMHASVHCSPNEVAAACDGVWGKPSKLPHMSCAHKGGPLATQPSAALLWEASSFLSSFRELRVVWRGSPGSLLSKGLASTVCNFSPLLIL